MKKTTLWRFAALLLVLVFALTACGPKATEAPTKAPAAAAATEVPAAAAATEVPAAAAATEVPAAPAMPFEGVELRVVGANHPWME